MRVAQIQSRKNSGRHGKRLDFIMRILSFTLRYDTNTRRIMWKANYNDP